MPESSQQSDSGGSSVIDKVVEMRHMRVRLPIVGEVTLPPPERLAYFLGIGVLAAVDLIEWPVALVIVTGHWLTNQHVSRVAKGLGEAMAEA